MFLYGLFNDGLFGVCEGGTFEAVEEGGGFMVA